MNIVYTDGASSGNPGPGGWAAIIDYGNKVLEIGDGDPKTTNNRMELTAVINALKKINKSENTKIYTDSQYVVNGITSWIFNWQKNDWKTKNEKEVLNKDLWQDLAKEVEGRKIEWKVIRGHAGISGNHRADRLAVTFASAVKPDLYDGPKKDYKIDISEPQEFALHEESTRDRSKSKAFSYLSLVDGVWQRHETWAECKSRVDGKHGAKFRKSVSLEDERDILKSWGVEV